MSVRRSMAWMLGSQGILFFLQFGGSVGLARLLTPYEMGVYAIASAVIGIIGIVQSFGIGLFVIRETAATESVLACAFTVNLLMSVLLAVVTIGLSAFGGAFLNEPGVRHVLLVLAVIPLIGVFEFRPATLLERNAEFRVIAGLNLFRAVVTTAATLTMAFLGYSYMSIAWGAVAGSLSGALGVMVARRRYISFRLGFTGWHEIMRFGMQQMAIQGVSAISSRLSEFMLGRLLGLEALGLWGRSSNLNNLLWVNIHLVIGRVMMVQLAQERREGRSLRTIYLHSLEVLTALLWPSFAGLAILAGPFIVIVYGQDWVAAAPPVAGLAVASILLVSLTMTWEVFVVCKETSRQARFEFLRTGVAFVLFVGGCLVNLEMASIARVGDAIYSLFLYRPHVERMTDTRWADFAPIYRRSAVLTAVACGPALILMFSYHWSPFVPASLLGAATLSGVVLWAVALKLLDHPLSQEIGRLIVKTRFRSDPV